MATVIDPKTNPVVEMIRLIQQEILNRLQRGELRYQRDRKTLLHHLSLAQEIGNPLLMGELHDMLGIVDNEVGNFEAAENHWQSAIQVFESIEQPSGMSSVYNNLGELYFHMDRLPEAQEAFYKARSLAEEADDKESIMRVEGNLGFWHLRHGDHLQAKVCFALVVAVTEMETWQHIYSLVMARRGLAEVNLAAHDFVGAWREANEAETLAAGRQLKLGLGLAFLTKAHIAQLDPSTPGAEEYYFQQGWETLKQYGNPIVLGQTYLGEAHYQQSMGHNERAKDYALAARDLFVQLELKSEADHAEALIKALA